MQVKRFEAPTLQEALENIKRELGPEAIILQTKQNKKGFGLLSKGSVEITAAISERSMKRKESVEKRLPEATREAVRKMPAERQAKVYEKVVDELSTKASDRVELGGRALGRPRYVDIQDDGARAAPAAAPRPSAPPPRPAPAPVSAYGLGVAQPQAPRPPEPQGSRVIEEEVRQLKRIITEMREAQESDSRQAALPAGSLTSPALQDAFEQLMMAGVDRRQALLLARKAAFELGDEGSKDGDSVLDQLAEEIMGSVEVASPLAGLAPGKQEIFALVGPTGVGKTTTLAKLASEAVLRKGLKVGLINLDRYRVGAFDQLATYAKILGVPFRSAASPEDLAAALADFKTVDLILVDTAGRSQKDTQALRETQALLEAVPGARSLLVLSATTRDTELYDVAARFAVLKPESLVFSKLDEAALFGSLFNVATRTKLPLSYLTTGQRVPEDIEPATRERVAALVMGI